MAYIGGHAMVDFLGNLINPHDRKIKELQKRVEKIISLEEEIKPLSDEELRNKTEEFKNRLKNGETLDGVLEEGFAVVREASHRVLGLKHFPVQLIGGIVLHEGNIAEMKTGEGKTLVSTLPAYLNALTEEGVFIITVNEYLAARDKEEMGKVHEFLGLSVGLIKREMTPAEKKEAYKCDIVYGTNSEFGFDYLRDNMAIIKDAVVQRKRNYAIVDEVDSILIDEARTPLIMTGESNRASQYYITVDQFVKSLKKEEDFEKDKEKQVVHLTQQGMDKAESIFNLKNIADIKNTELLHHIRQSLHANYIMERDKDYVVKNKEIVIVDKFTGRLMPGRRFGGGLHQAIEAKEKVEIQKESKTMALITFQNYFKLFNKIGGMTGTAYTEKGELKSIYGIEVMVIPTNKPIQRKDKEDVLFKTKEEKFKAVVKEVEKRHEKGQPVLLGSIYIDESEKLSEMLQEKKIVHRLLNAKQDKDEAQIIAMAGQKGAVTIATNMAGRGTDIKLEEGVDALGGLYVLGTEKHDARRIDNQLRGRAGRQGDPGESQFFASLEDSLFEKVNPEAMERVKKVVDKFNLKEGEGIQDKLVSQAIEGIQKNVEVMHYNIRQSTLEFDQILNRQRETIYNERNKILNGEDMGDFIKDLIKDFVQEMVHAHTWESPYPEEWDLFGLEEALNQTLYFNKRVNLKDLSKEEIENLTKEELKNKITKEALDLYEEKEKILGEKQLRYLERLTLMKSIDEKWIDHLDVVEQLRQGIGFLHIGGQNPIRIFNQEVFQLFEDMLKEIKALTIKSLFLLAGITGMQEKEKQSLLDLEDQYKINRKYLMRIPSDTPIIKFNVDINATEEIDAQVFLCYMEHGFEEKLKDSDKKLRVKGKFPMEFHKPEDKDWKIGWYQGKVMVSGQEANVVNFLIVDVKEEEERNHVQQMQFFSNEAEEISFDIGLKGYKENKIMAGLMYNQDKNNIIPLELPVEKEEVRVGLSRPVKGWTKGLYELILVFEKNNIILPFMLVEEYHHEEEEINVKFKLQVKEGKKLNLDAQLIYLEENLLMRNLPFPINKSGTYVAGFKKKEKAWEKGKYEFRLVLEEEIILKEYILIS